MAKTRTARSSGSASGSLIDRLDALVGEQFPFAAAAVRSALAPSLEGIEDAAQLDAMRGAVRKKLLKIDPALTTKAEITPGVDGKQRGRQAQEALCLAVDGFLRRESIAASISSEERLEMLRGMLLTRATDNRLKQFFLASEVRFDGAPFQGKGFRSLGQEAIYAAPLRFKRGAAHRGEEGWEGDVVAPLIRDLGAALAMRPEAESVRLALSAQMGKAGPPMFGKDFHIGDLDWGVLPASAPLSISSLSAAGMAMAFSLQGSKRVAACFIGEGGSSLGEWHESINLCAARRLPAIFCLQNNQTALSTPVSQQSSVRTFADKALGYGVPGLTVNGTDPEAIAAAFAWAAERARAGEGPTLIEVVAMRMCGHAHHDDMLYHGKEQPPGWEYPKLIKGGYANAEIYAYWSERDPITTYAARLTKLGLIDKKQFAQMQQEAEALVADAAKSVIDAPWPEGREAGVGVLADEPPRCHVEPLEARKTSRQTPLPELDPGPAYNPKGSTFIEAVMLGVGDALRADPRTFVYGQDVGGSYGNAFLLLRPLLEEFGDRILNSTLAEGGIIGVCVGSALAGMRPIGEIQFNDFIATGFNQLVNNAAKSRYRWGGGVPMTLRMPWGGLRRAGPFHSQNTEPWFYRTPGLKIVTPSTPHDARSLMAAAAADPDPVLFYEHIGLYRDPKIKQKLGEGSAQPMPLGQAALRRAGSDLAIISYGAYVHVALRVAEKLATDGIEASVLDLRTLVPLDRERLLAVARHCGKVLIVHEDSRTGGIGESLAAIIQEEAFEQLDAPIRVVGALDTPVPYSPPLEAEFLPGPERVERAARLLAAY